MADCPHHGPECEGHLIAPLLADMPSADPPNAGRCLCGQVGYLWQVPLDGRYYCRRCIRAQLRVATWPETIRFPGD